MCGHDYHNQQNWRNNQQSANDATNAENRVGRGQTQPLGQRAILSGDPDDTRRFDQAEIEAATQSQQQNFNEASQQQQTPVNNAPGHGYWGRGWGFPWWLIFFIWPLFGWLGHAFSAVSYYSWGHGFLSFGVIWPLLIVGAIVLIGMARRSGYRRW